MPLIIPLAYYLILPRDAAFFPMNSSTYDDIQNTPAGSSFLYTSIPAADGAGEDEGNLSSEKGFSLSVDDKWRLVKPLLLKYMLPLCELQTFHNLSSI